MVLSLMLVTVNQVLFSNQLHEMNDINRRLNDEIADVKKNHSELMQMPLFNYPSEGISFEAINWENLLVTNNKEERFTAEHELAYQLSPFLGRTIILIFIDQPMQEISLTLASTLMTKEDLSFWEENWQKLLDDMASTSLITQATFSVRVFENLEESFEQTVVRDGELWNPLTRRPYIIDKVKESEMSSVEPSEKEDKETNEQKGSVEIDK
jgi:hypothetical protein